MTAIIYYIIATCFRRYQNALATRLVFHKGYILLELVGNFETAELLSRL
jgi:hypothetical protein